MADRRCFICGEDNPNVLQTHHVVPRRFGGGDTRQNRATLCANCHEAIEKLYDNDFFVRLATNVDSCPWCSKRFIDGDLERHIKSTVGGGHGDHGEVPDAH